MADATPLFLFVGGGVLRRVDTEGLSVPTVAWLGVKVLPDTSGMWRETKRAVDWVERSLEPVNIDIDLDSDRIVERANELHRELERALRPVTQEMRLELDKDGARSIAEVQRDVLNVEADAADRLKHSFDDEAQSLDVLRRKHRALFERKAFEDREAFWRGLEHKPWAGAVADKWGKEKIRTRRGVIRIEPDASWKSRVAGELDRFFRKEYRGQVEFEVLGSDSSLLQRADEKIRREFAEQRNWRYVVDLDADLKSGRMDSLLDGLRQRIREKAFGSKGEFEFHVKPEMSREELRSLGHRLKKFKREWDKTELEFKLGLDHSARYITVARLAWLARDRWVSFKPIVDSKAFAVAKATLDALSGFRLARDLTQNLWDMVKNMDKSVPLIGLVASGLAVAASAASVLAMHTLTVGAGIVRAAEALALFAPGMAVAGGILAASFIVPLKNITDYVKHIKDDFSQLSKDMGSSFWDQARERFEQAYRGLFPRFREGLKSTSKAAGEHFASVLVSLDKIVGPAMERQFAHTARALDELSKHSDGFAKVLRVLGDIGTDGFERTVGWLGRMTDRWADWLVTAQNTGHLQEIIDRGLREFHALGQVVVQTSRLFAGLTDVARAAGGASVEALAGGLKHAADVVRTQGFVEGFWKTLAGAREAWTHFRETVGGQWNSFWKATSNTFHASAVSMGDAAGSLMRGLLQALSTRGVQDGFKSFFSDLAVGMRLLQPMWARLGDGLGALLRVAGSFARGFAPVIASTLGALSNAVVKLEPTVSRLALSLGPRLANTIDVLSPMLTRVADVLLRVLEVVSRIPFSVEAATVAFLGVKAWNSISGIVKTVAGGFDTLSLKMLYAADGLSGAAGKVSGFGAAGKAAAGGLRGLSGALRAVEAAAGPLGLLFLGASAALAAFDAVVEAAERKVERSTDRIRSTLSDTAASTKQMTVALQNEFAKIQAEAEKMHTASYVDRDTGIVHNDLYKGNVWKEALSQYKELGVDAEKTWSHWFSQRVGEHERHVANLTVQVGKFGKQLGQLAESDGPGAVRALATLGESWVKAGVPVQDTRDALNRMLDDNPLLVKSLEDLNRSLGFSTERWALLDTVMRGSNLTEETQARLMARRAESMDALNAALDQLTAGWGLSYKQMQSGLPTLLGTGQAFTDIGNAARDASGKSVQSVDEFRKNLDKMHEDQKRWSENVTVLMKNGFTKPMIDEFARLPEGARFVQELRDKIDEGSPEARESVKRMLDTMAYETTEGMARISAMGGDGVASMLESMAGSMSKVQGLIAEPFRQEGLDAGRVLAASTPEGLQAALDEAGASLRQSGTDLVLTFADGMQYTLPGAIQGVGDGTANEWAKQSGLLQGHFHKSGQAAMSSFADGLNSVRPDVRAAAAELVRDNRAGFETDNHKYRDIALKQAQQYADAFGTKSQDARSAGTGMANNVDGGAGSVSFYGTGQYGAQGFVRGIASGNLAASAAGRDLADHALTAAQRRLDEHSPSREMFKVGAFFSQGFANGIDRMGFLAVEAADGLASDTLGRVEDRAARLKAYDGARVTVEEEQVKTVRLDPSSFRGVEMALNVDGGEFRGYVSDVADSRVSAGFDAVYA